MNTMHNAKLRHEQQQAEMYSVNYDEILELFCYVDDAAKAIKGAVKFGRERMVDYPGFLMLGVRINTMKLNKLSMLDEMLRGVVCECSSPTFGYTTKHLAMLKTAKLEIDGLIEYQKLYLEKQAREREERHMMQIKMGYGY